MTHHLRRYAVILFALIAAFSGACSDDAEVGSGVDEQGGGQGGNLAVGDETTTTATPETTAPPAAPTTARPAATTAPPTTQRPTTTAPPQATFKININSDQSSEGQFAPNNAAVRAGTIVEFVNNDSVPRSVVAQSGAFRSPEIPPGGSWKWKAQPGTYNYQDGTRPYAVGSLSVQ